MPVSVQVKVGRCILTGYKMPVKGAGREPAANGGEPARVSPRISG